MPRIEYGKYVRCKPLIRELYVEHGIPTGLIAETIGVSTRTLTARISEWGFKAERERLNQETVDRFMEGYEHELAVQDAA